MIREHSINSIRDIFKEYQEFVSKIDTTKLPNESVEKYAVFYAQLKGEFSIATSPISDEYGAENEEAVRWKLSLMYYEKGKKEMLSEEISKDAKNILTNTSDPKSIEFAVALQTISQAIV